MPSLTTRVTEKDIRIDEAAFFAFAESAKGHHIGWLREISSMLVGTTITAAIQAIVDGTDIYNRPELTEIRTVESSQ